MTKLTRLLGAVWTAVLWATPALAQVPEQMQQEQTTTKQAIILCVTLLVCATIISVGVYFGLRAMGGNRTPPLSGQGKEPHES